MAVFELVLFVVAAVLVSSFLSRFIPKVSTPLVQILLGLILSQLPFFPNIQLDPELFMVLFIAPLLYLEAHSIDKQMLWRSLKLSLSLAIGLAVATMAAVGFMLHALWAAVPLAAALALGAALGPTDAVAVSSLGNEASLTKRQAGVLKGESLFNDASGIVGFQFAISAAITGKFEVTEAITEFIFSFIVGAIYGVIIGLILNIIFETFRSLGWENMTTRILIELFLPFLIYLSAEAIHVSGILAVVAAGLMLRFDRSDIGPNVARTNIVSDSVWNVFSFTLNGAVFIMLGMLLPGAMQVSWEKPTISHGVLIASIFVVALVVIGMRFAWVSGLLALAKSEDTHERRHMDATRWRSALVMTFGGPKGTITLSLMFTIPYYIAGGIMFPMRDELIFIASGVIILTLLAANFLLPVIAPNKETGDANEINKISIEVLRRTVEELADQVTPENRRAVMTIINSYTKRITRLKHRVGQAVDMSAFVDLQVKALNWEKDYVKKELAQAKQRLAESKNPISDEQIATEQAAACQVEIEACERLLDQIMRTLRHVNLARTSESEMWRARGRFRLLKRRAGLLGRRIVSVIRRTTPLVSEDMIFARMRTVQLDAIHYVIEKLSDEMGADDYNTEFVSALLLDYRRAESTLRRSPDVGESAKLVAKVEEVKRDSYAIELNVIQDMLEAGEITRTQAKRLRENVYVMSVDADANF